MLHKLVDELVDNTPYMERMQRVYVSQSIVSTTVALLSLHTYIYISQCVYVSGVQCAHSRIRLFACSIVLLPCSTALKRVYFLQTLLDIRV